MANFRTIPYFFFWQKKKSKFTTEISFCEFGQKSQKKGTKFIESSPCWLPGPPKIIQIGPHLEQERSMEPPPQLHRHLPLSPPLHRGPFLVPYHHLVE